MDFLRPSGGRRAGRLWRRRDAQPYRRLFPRLCQQRSGLSGCLTAGLADNAGRADCRSGRIAGGGGSWMSLAGKVVLVTGAQEGIGAAMAGEFAAAGADVGVNWLDDEAAARRVADRVRAAGRRALLAQADVARHDAVR